MGRGSGAEGEVSVWTGKASSGVGVAAVWASSGVGVAAVWVDSWGGMVTVGLCKVSCSFVSIWGEDWVTGRGDVDCVEIAQLCLEGCIVAVSKSTLVLSWDMYATIELSSGCNVDERGMAELCVGRVRVSTGVWA